MTPVDAWTASELMALLRGQEIDEDQVSPGIALSEPIMESLFVKADTLLYDDERAELRCRCGHLGPPYTRREVCSDCEVEHAEEDAWQRLLKFRRWLAAGTCLREWDARFPQLIRDPIRQFWRLRWRHVRWCDVMQNLSILLSADKTGPEPDGVALDAADLPDAVVASDEGQAALIDRKTAAHLTYFYLAAPTPYVRFFDPISAASLALLPREVAVAVGRICASYDGEIAKGTRSVSGQLRRACQSLADFEVRSNGDYIMLMYRNNRHVLIRYEKEPPSRKVTATNGWAPGCQLRVLPETEKELRKEIATCNKKNGKVMKRAKRFTVPDPGVRKTPDDRRSIEQSFIGRRVRTASGTDSVRTRDRRHRRE